MKTADHETHLFNDKQHFVRSSEPRARRVPTAPATRAHGAHARHSDRCAACTVCVCAVPLRVCRPCCCMHFVLPCVLCCVSFVLDPEPTQNGSRPAPPACVKVVVHVCPKKEVS